MNNLSLYLVFADWSILYVFVAIIMSFLLLSGLFWGITCACRQTKKPPKRPKLQKYSLIGNNDEEAPQCEFNSYCNFFIIICILFFYY